MANLGDSLTPKQTRAIQALLVSRTVAEAAQAAGVGFRTLTRWLTEPEFRAALREAQEQALDAAVSRLAGAAVIAADTLQTIAESDTAQDGPRVSAARAILTTLLTIREQRDLAERISALEERLA